MKKLNDWFEIDEKQYMWHILQGYHIFVDESYVIWKINGKMHRTDGPALIREDGTRVWYIDGKLHRTDGPAVIWADGSKAWYIDGIEYPEEEFNETVKELSC